VGTLVGGHRRGRIWVAQIQGGVGVFGTLEMSSTASTQNRRASQDSTAVRRPGRSAGGTGSPSSVSLAARCAACLLFHRGKFGQDLPSLARRGVGKAAVPVGAVSLRRRQATKPAGCLRISTHRALTCRPG